MRVSSTRGRSTTTQRSKRHGAFPAVIGGLLLFMLIHLWTACKHATSLAIPTAAHSSLTGMRTAAVTMEPPPKTVLFDEISEQEPLHVLIAGGGVGGLALANALVKVPTIKVTVLEKNCKIQAFWRANPASIKRHDELEGTGCRPVS